MTCATLGHTCQREDLRINQGSTWARTLNFANSSGTAINLTGCTIRGMVRKNKLDVSPAITLTCAVTDATNGVATVLMTAADSTALTVGERITDTASLYWYDIEIVWSDSTVQRFLEGDIRFSAECTK
jgi:hypothetical protein